MHQGKPTTKPESVMCELIGMFRHDKKMSKAEMDKAANDVDKLIKNCPTWGLQQITTSEVGRMIDFLPPKKSTDPDGIC